MQLLEHPAGEYRYLTGIAPYSAGVIATPGHGITHVTLRTPLPYRAGFTRIHEYLEERGRPRHALCAVELRIPAPFSFAGFSEFNADYQTLLAEWDLLVEGRNPVARTNVAPTVHAPDEPVLHAFSYATPLRQVLAGEPFPSFIVAGAGDLRDQADLTTEAVVRPGESTPDALREKVNCVLDVMEARLGGLGMGWPQVTDINVYTKHHLQKVWTDTLFARLGSTAPRGIHWTLSEPPIRDLAFEMDVRGVQQATWL
jgi:hypothetical protein